MGIFKGEPLESVFGYFCQKTKVTRRRQDKVNLALKTKTNSKGTQKVNHTSIVSHVDKTFKVQRKKT